MRSRTIIELVGSAAGFGMLVLRYANQISNSLQFISLPEELKGALIAMSKIPTLLAWAIFFIGLGALGFLIYDTKPVALAGMGSRFRKTLVQPLQLIILGLVIAAIGAAWQLMRSAPTAISQTDNEKRITSLVKELDAAKRTVANYEARDQAKASADALVSLAKNWPESAADRELRGMAALHTTESAPKPSTARFKPQYEPEEISQMLTALRNMRGIIEKMPTFEEREAVRWAWSKTLKAGGIAEMGQKIKDISDRTLSGLNALDRLIQIDNKHFSEELQPVAFLPGDHEIIGAFSATSSQLSSDLNELSRAQNLDVEKWTRTHFDEWQSSGTKYGDWISRSNSRITAMTKDLREWKNP